MRVTAASLTVARAHPRQHQRTQRHRHQQRHPTGWWPACRARSASPASRRPTRRRRRSIPPIPRWDFNPELLSVDSDAAGHAAALDVAAGAHIEDLTGPLDYSFRRYTILRDLAAPHHHARPRATRRAPAPRG